MTAVEVEGMLVDVAVEKAAGRVGTGGVDEDAVDTEVEGVIRAVGVVVEVTGATGAAAPPRSQGFGGEGMSTLWAAPWSTSWTMSKE